MPLLGFKKQFIPSIEAGWKKHTIRGDRKYPIKVGDTLYLYYALRTRQARKIGEAICTQVQQIVIRADFAIFVDGTLLGPRQATKLARSDGFLTLAAMEKFWTDNNELPFRGQIIHWEELT